MKKNINDRNKSSGTHSFYKEANKSILGQEQMTPKKFGKLSFKVIKWMVFAFLIITTLWGCVNEFILKTSNNLGQGVEFYQGDGDFIYPNMYQATEVVGYTAAPENVNSGTGYENPDGKKYETTYDYIIDGETYTSNPVPPTAESFNFYVMNPNFGLSFEGVGLTEDMISNINDDINNDELISDADATSYIENELQVNEEYIKSSQIKTFSINSEQNVSSIKDAPKAYSYNLNELTVKMTGLYNYDIEKQWYGGTEETAAGLYSLDTTVSKSILGVANNDVQANFESSEENDLSYPVTNMKSFAFYLADLNYGEVDGKMNNLISDDNGKTFFSPINLGDDDSYAVDGEYTYSEISGINGVVRLKEGAATGITAEYKPEYNDDDPEHLDKPVWKWTYSGELAFDDFEFVTNDKAETTITDGKEVIDEGQEVLAVNQFIRKQTFLSGDLSGGTTDKLITANVYDDVFDAYGYEEEVSAEPLSALTDDTWSVYSGAQLVVTPIEKGFPVEASHDTQILIDGKDENGNSDLSNPNGDANVVQFRAEGFNEIDLTQSENREQGMDYETQMYGWMLMDSSENEDGTFDMLRTYASAEQAAWDREVTESTTDKEKESILKHTEGMTNEEKDYLYADQRREGWGAVNYGQTKEQEVYTVFDEKIKDMMNSNLDTKEVEPKTKKETFLSLDRSVIVNGETISYTTATTFAGMTSMDAIMNIDDSYMGVLPQTTSTGSAPTTEVPKDTRVYYERSILSDSIIPTGQDSWGESRVAFVGWDDWGKAWDVKYGPMYGMFVFPLAQISMGVGQVFNYHNSPWGTLASIVVIVFLTRGLGALLSLKGTKNQMKMQEVQTDVAKIKARYSKYDFKEEPKMKQKQQQEIMALYRKNDVSPMGSLGTIFITMPIFISLWIIISALPAYKLVVMGNFSWAISSFSGIFGGLGFGILLLYLLVGVTVGLVQGVSSKLPNWLANKRKGIKRVDQATKDSMKKQNRTQNIMVGVFVFMGLTVPALFAFYWIVSGSFTIVLELSRHGWRTHAAKEIKLDPTYKSPTEKISHSIKSLFHKS